jgi:hypothetical protein
MQDNAITIRPATESDLVYALYALTPDEINLVKGENEI